ncbi:MULTISPECIES: amidohydrolase family protein [Gammaproteobacteria]|uniref:amidohydrolase family protein n=1 Tax=Gammaproteobacteria TaxID=1236 RepID=UPI000DD0E488|nr:MULTISPECIES: amidohydrolase family protein [Gammaproteobacteria]RTE87541.1 amidohydrolase [Aliidiomarina sp. B3213]TCZ92674.1 amidohydrolase [Lysobacter sp. N42]
MKKFIFSIIACVSFSVSAHNIAPGSSSEQSILLQGGTVHTVSSGTYPETDILMTGDTITAIGRDITAPEGTRVIDVSGQHIYPGLIAIDTTLGLIELEQARPTDDVEEVGDVTPEVVAHHAFNADSEIIPTVRYLGITHSLIVPEGDLVRGQSSLMHLDGWNWQDALQLGSLGMHVTWPRTGLNNAWWEWRTPAQQREANAEARRELQDVFTTAEAYHHARTSGNQDRIDQRWEAMRGLFSGDMKLFIHANDRRQIEEALAFNAEYGFDMVLVGGRDAWMMTDVLVENDLPVVFTSPYGLPAREDEAYDTAYATPAKLYEAGVQFAIGYAGYWDSRNLAFGAGNAVAYGLEYQQALRSITLSAAEILGVEDTLGSIQVGKQATLIVSRGDVLDHLGQDLSMMFIEGREVELTSKQKQLFEKYQERITE